MIDDIKTYFLSAELRNEGSNFTDISRFEYVLQVFEIEERQKELTFWEALSKSRFSDDDSFGLTGYKINMVNVVLNLCPGLQQATDFIRRLAYAYDSIELMMNQNGQIHKISNVEELQGNWLVIKQMLKADYKGKVTDAYLKGVDEEISRWSFLNVGRNYLIYGLLFPGVPHKHHTDRTGERTIAVSRYDGELMQEVISYSENTDDVRKYSITGKLSDNSSLQLEQFEGKLFIKNGQLLPDYATVGIRYKNGDVLNAWKFKLERY